MKRPTLLLSTFPVIALFAVAACGGTVSGDIVGGGNGSPNDGGADGSCEKCSNPDGSTLPQGIEGSFDLTFSQATADFKGQYPPGVSPPSLTVASRLDIRKGPAGGYEAVFTSRWGTSVSLAVAASDAQVALTGNATVAGAGGVSDTWNQLVLPRDAQGKLTGEVRGTGTTSVTQGDVGFIGTLSGKGAVVTDRTQPELKARLVSRIGPDGELLPWDDIAIGAAEPVTPSGVREHTTITGTPGKLALTWTALNRPDSWVGETAYAAHITDWTTAGSVIRWDLETDGDAVRDLVALKSKGGISSAVSFRNLGFATSRLDFSSDVLNGTSWGPNAIYGGGLTGAIDPRCEGGSCMRVGPVSYDLCNVPRAGLAGLLQLAASGHVQLRYRLLAKPKSGDTPYLYGDALTLELARQGGSVTDSGANVSGKLVKLAAPIDGMTHATDWTTLDVPAPSGTGNVGFAVAIGGPSNIGSRGGCGGPMPVPSDVEVLVAYVASK